MCYVRSVDAGTRACVLAEDKRGQRNTYLLTTSFQLLLYHPVKQVILPQSN